MRKLFLMMLVSMLFTSLVLFYCEFMIYFIVLLQCKWPTVRNRDSTTLRVMMLADTHLLGRRTGHWFDKLRREWQMYRAFQTSMILHSSDVVFVLGDLFDEGMWAHDDEFDSYVKHFNSLFSVPEETQLYATMGNHDVGFHYMMDAGRIKLFEKHFKTESIRMLQLKDNIFILINSMAFEGDDCLVCQEAERQLNKISLLLNCNKDLRMRGSGQCADIRHINYSKPIILQHFPLYRTNDAMCDGHGSATSKEKYRSLQDKWDCLSKEATNLLIEKLEPRLVVSGHTHHFCRLLHKNFPEWTIASFNWRNNKNPSFILAEISTTDMAIDLCAMPSEMTVIYIYIVSAIALILLLLFMSFVKITDIEHYKHKII